MTLQLPEVVSQQFVSFFLLLKFCLFLLKLPKLAHALVNLVLNQLLKARVQRQLLHHFICYSIRRVLNNVEVERGSC